MDKLREAVEHLLNTCPPIDASGEEAHARARAALAEPVADEPVAWLAEGTVYAVDAAVIPPAVDADLRASPADNWQPLYTRPAPAPAERGEYPPLPTICDGIGDYTADQMRAYVDADRAQRVPLTEDQVFASQDLMYLNGSLLHLAMPQLIEVIRTVEHAHGIGAKP